MSGKREGAQETPQERAMTELAMQRISDYKQRWLPLQRNLAQQITKAGAPDSFERRRARGMATTEAAGRFAQTQRKLEAGLAQPGAGGLGSSRGKLAVAGAGEDRATSMGLGMAGADQAIDDAYMAGLSQLMAIGRGERAGATRGFVSDAARASQQAEFDARTSLEGRMGDAMLAGQIIGTGVGYGRAGGFKGVGDRMQAKFAQTGVGSSGFGTGLAYGNEDMGVNF